MKNLILFFILFISFNGFSQKPIKDTSEICFPYPVAKKIALDLNKLDSVTNVSKLTDIELNETKKKVMFQENIINTMEQKEKNYELQIQKEGEKYKIVDEQNKELRKEVKKLKVKNTVIEIVGGSIITILSGAILFK
jgi:hypothetical protein